MFFFFFFNDTATTEIYTLSLHDALPISPRPITSGTSRADKVGADLGDRARSAQLHRSLQLAREDFQRAADRKSTRLNSSHLVISYAVFCLKKKKKKLKDRQPTIDNEN